MWVLACCDDAGKCIGFLRKDYTVSSDQDGELDKLMQFKRKKDTSEIVNQINLSHMLLPTGQRFPFRVTPVK